MKVLYIVIDEFDILKESGVSRKISSKINSFKENKADIILLSVKTDVTTSDNKITWIDDVHVELLIGLKNVFKGRLNKIKSDFYFYAQLSSHLKTFSFDKIIFRYPGASRGLLNFTKILKGKIFFEHNTIEIDEARLYESKMKHIGFSFRPSGFFYWFQEKKMRVLNEKYIAPVILKYAAGGICITDEIAAHEKTKFKSYKTIVSCNGFDFDEKILYPKKFIKDDKLIIGFVISSNLPWFGLKRIYDSLLADKSNSNIEIHVVGIDEPTDMVHSKLKFMGFLSGNELKEFYHAIHITFGPMALYKKKLQYASALKIKESMAYGIPFVIAYREQGISDNYAYKNYVLELPNDNSLINFLEVYNFAVNFYSKPDNAMDLYRLGKKDFSFNVITRKIINEIGEY